VPSVVLLGWNADFQEAWFGVVSVDRIVDFADLRRLLFPGAKHPCVAVRYSAGPPSRGATVSYETPKTGVASQLGGPVLIFDEDRVRISLSEILWEAKEGRASLVWKSRLWGTPRDRRLLQRLADMPRLAEVTGKPGEAKRWINGQGFQPYTETDRKQRRKKLFGWWEEEHLFLGAKSPNIHFLVTQDDCGPVGTEFDVLRRLPDSGLFDGPKVLTSQGSRNMKVAFCDFAVLFRDSLQSIAGPAKDAPLLRFLTAVIHSRFAEYYLFHTSANLGTERDKTHFFELLRLPFPLPEQTPQPATSSEIVADVSAQIQGLGKRIQAGELDLGRQEAALALRHQLEPLIHKYYDVDPYEAMLIEDTLTVFKPSSTPGSPKTSVPALRRAREPDRIQYVDTLRGALRTRTVPGFKGHIIGTVTLSARAGVALVTLSRSHEPRDTIAATDPKRLSKSLARLAKRLLARRGTLAYVRNVKVIERGRIHIVKPLTLRSWTRTAALNDADEILGAILLRGGRR
jgi:hypothetical protein